MGGCWVWMGAINAVTGGAFNRGDRKTSAHRFAYETFVGPIPAGLEVDHLCRVRECCNPAHLEVVTHKVNANRGQSPAAIRHRATHCAEGHPFADTAYIKPTGKRICRTCENWKRNERRRIFGRR